jgi:hypothetical protein
MDGNYEKNIYNNLIEYYKKEYNTIIKLDTNLKLIEKISNNKYINYNYEYSSINNFIDILNIKMNIQVDRINSLCSVFKIKKGDKIINYAYLFSIVDTNKYKEYKNNKKKITDVIEHSFVTTSPNLISMDGEFRHRLIDITNIYLLNKYTSLINYLEIYIYTKFENEDINILYEYFNIYDKQLETLLYDNIINTKITMKLFIISWLCEIMNIINNTKQININDEYYNIMYTKKDITIIKNYINNKTNLNNINEFINDFTYVNNISHKLELSQKIIPQSNYEFKNYSKLITRIGTELLINNIVTNLKYNLVSNSFSMFYNWFFISNSRKTLYDNENIIKLIEYNELNKNILNYLFNSKTELNNINNNDNISNKQIYTKLLNNINTNIKIIEQKLLMADISSCFIFEYIGKTFYNNINNINIYNLLFNDYNLFSKIIFDIIYGLYCLNINGIIHGDLHLNNITINNRYIDKQKDSYILYNLNSNIHENIIEHINKKKIENNKINNNVYLFEDNSYTACIIDYSRSYIMLKSINEDILEKYKNKSRNEFIKEEKKRYIKDLSHLFPNYVNNNKHKIDILFNTINFEKFFIYFSAIDIFKFSTNLLLYLDNKKLTYNKKIYDLLVNISKESYNYLEKIINDNSYLDSSELKSYPNYIILNKYFKDFEISNIKEKKDIKNISNIFNFDNINLTNNVYKHKYFDFHITDKDKKIINNEKNINYKKDFIINNNDNNINLEKFINENLYNYKFKNMNNIDTNDTLIDTSMINLTDTLN